MRYIVVGTAGHIDHGKSALVQALTGTNPDRLEEEKRRGITIDLGFAHLDLGEDLRVAFVDVPGHERFIKNMLAGVGGIDLVLLVVAADESIKPQTREHFDICKLLGIRAGLVAITKSDLVEKDVLDLVALEIQDMVRGSFLEGAPMVPVSARTADGLDHLKSELRLGSSKAAPKSIDRPIRLPIDRAFVMKGFGAVVTGTLIAGKIAKEAEVEVFPLGRRARVRGIEVHNLPAAEAWAGQRTALNLVGLEARDLARGMVLAEPGLFKTTDLLDCALTLLPAARPLKNHARVHFHCWTAETIAEVALFGARELRPGERAYAQLRLAEGGLFLPGDRFIIRQFSALITLGGGVVVDNLPPRHKGDPTGVLAFLETMEAGSAASRLELLAQQYGEVPALTLVARTGWPLAEVSKIAKHLEAEQRLKILAAPPGLVVPAKFFDRLAQKVVQELGAFHSAQPLAPGLSKEDLRGRISGGGNSREESAVISTALFNSLLASLSAQGKLRVQGELVQLAGREIQLSAEEAAAQAAISSAFEKAGLAVPSAREVIQGLKIDRPRAEKLLQILLKEKVLLKITDDLIFHQAALSKLRQMLAQRKAQSDRLNVGVFKEITGLSRKYAIPLLEYLDRERVTRRQGDERIIL
ncbi:MAG TPA: selenocysteine-specific translation elongation factor [Terriglobia bacterium]|nr:selenocysteine-specific translation elongation factor [Terriglobia bacterium]